MTEKQPPDIKNSPPPADAALPARLPETMEAACEMLAAALVAPDYPDAMLRRQAQILDSVFYKVMESYLPDDTPAPPPEDESEAEKIARLSAEMNAARQEPDLRVLDLALRVQKQCMDTAKAVGQMDYMKMLGECQAPRKPQLPVPPAPASLPPSLPKNNERKEGP